MTCCDLLCAKHILVFREHSVSLSHYFRNEHMERRCEHEKKNGRRGVPSLLSVMQRDIFIRAAFKKRKTSHSGSRYLALAGQLRQWDTLDLVWFVLVVWRCYNYEIQGGLSLNTVSLLFFILFFSYSRAYISSPLLLLPFSMFCFRLPDLHFTV